MTRMESRKAIPTLRLRSYKVGWYWHRRCAKCRSLRQAQGRLFDSASRDGTARGFAQDDTFCVSSNCVSAMSSCENPHLAKRPPDMGHPANCGSAGEGSTSAAKAAIQIERLAARLKPCP